MSKQYGLGYYRGFKQAEILANKTIKHLEKTSQNNYGKGFVHSIAITATMMVVGCVSLLIQERYFNGY